MLKGIEAENIIKELFMTEAQMNNVKKYYMNRNVILSFRAAKKDTIQKLSKGAAPKPHSILEKTLKRDDLIGIGEKYSDDFSGLVAYRTNEPLVAIKVGRKTDIKNSEKTSRYKGNGIYGLYISNDIKEEEIKKEFDNEYFVVLERTKNKVLYFSPEIYGDISNWFDKISSISNYERFFVTGDYDMHDLVYYRFPVPSNSWQEASALLEISKVIDSTHEGSISNGVYYPHTLNPIQHGPQYNYIAYMMTTEKDKEISRKVSKADNEIALFSNGEWHYLHNNSLEKQGEELAKIYKENGLTLKWTWESGEKTDEFLDRIM